MGRYLLRRTVASLALLWVVLSASFLVLHLAPGDPVERFLDPRVPRAQFEHLRRVYGLDRPLAAQYLSWLGAAARGDWGTSFQYLQPVRSVIVGRLPATLTLGTSAFAVQMLVGLALGIAAARRPGSLTDHGLRGFALTLYSVPGFWLAVMLILVFAGVLEWLPTNGIASPFASDWGLGRRALDLAAHLILPSVALGLPLSAPVGRILRNSLVEELQREYVLASRARGLPESRILLGALRNAAAPLVQLAGLSLPALLGGSVVIESVFSWPGLGYTAFSAIEARDYPLVLGLTSFTAALVIAGNLAADLLLAALDPRIAEGR